MIPRIWSLAREPWVKDWTVASQPRWDAAVAGNSALRECFLRMLGRKFTQPWVLLSATPSSTSN
eukprot:2357355-Pyramimonas_sp.AAC.1